MMVSLSLSLSLKLLKLQSFKPSFWSILGIKTQEKSILQRSLQIVLRFVVKELRLQCSLSQHPTIPRSHGLNVTLIWFVLVKRCSYDESHCLFVWRKSSNFQALRPLENFPRDPPAQSRTWSPKQHRIQLMPLQLDCLQELEKSHGGWPHPKYFLPTYDY